MFCIYCAAEEHQFCDSPDYENNQCCCAVEPSLSLGLVIAESDTKVYRDPISTGRKQAKQAKPLLDGAPCEWAGLAEAGGGVMPIIGCRPGENIQEAIHHGPDKNTLNNSDSNLHRICVKCHNRWHTENDKFYGIRPDQSLPFLPPDKFECKQHNPVEKATPEEIEESEARWKRYHPKTAPVE